MENQEHLKKELLGYLAKSHTHASLDDAIKDFPVELMNKKPEGLPYTFWGLLEHIRITQHDMVDFIQSPNYKELEWPKDYWPDGEEEATEEMWDAAIEACKIDMDTLKVLVKDPATDLLAKIPRGSGQTILQEIMQVIDHASYHTGEFVLMRRIFKSWKQ